MEQKVICPSCGIENSPGQQFCGDCGAKLPTPVTQEEVVCPNCGAKSPVTRQFCGSCGASMSGMKTGQGVVCPSCGFQNIAGQLFCGSCGAKLAAPKPEPTVETVASEVSTKSEEKDKTKAPVTPIPSTTPVMSIAAPEVSAMPAATAKKPEKPSIRQEQVVVKPTMGLAWGLYWRMLLLSLLIGLIVYLIIFGVMLAMGGTMPSWP